ncbi:MAG: substrate-binding periplasmic protein [Bdellovibrionales bacterium]
MKLVPFFAVAFIAAMLAVVVNDTITRSYHTVGTEKQESRWEHIKRTGELRCGYLNYPPLQMKDPVTGRMGGLFTELVEEIGRELNVKIVWVSEVANAQIMSDLNLNRLDMICAPFYVTPGRAREGSFSIPFMYHPSYIYVRADDTRFDNDYARANNSDVTFSTQDGEFSAIVVREHFPKAKTASIPQLSSPTELFTQVTDKKADAVVLEPFGFMNFNRNNPHKLRQVLGEPVAVTAFAMPLPAHEPDFKEAIDGTITYLLGMGAVEKLLEKYETPELKFLHLAKPYAIAK